MRHIKTRQGAQGRPVDPSQKLQMVTALYDVKSAAACVRHCEDRGSEIYLHKEALQLVTVCYSIGYSGAGHEGAVQSLRFRYERQVRDGFDLEDVVYTEFGRWCSKLRRAFEKQEDWDVAQGTQSALVALYH